MLRPYTDRPTAGHSRAAPPPTCHAAASRRASRRAGRPIRRRRAPARSARSDPPPPRGRRGKPGARPRSTTDRPPRSPSPRSEEHTSELQSRSDLVCRLLLEKKLYLGIIKEAVRFLVVALQLND